MISPEEEADHWGGRGGKIEPAEIRGRTGIQQHALRREKKEAKKG